MRERKRPVPNKCKRCRGTGKKYEPRTCLACKGQGWRLKQDGCEYTCVICKGKTRVNSPTNIQCDLCKGTGSGFVHEIFETCSVCDGQYPQKRTCENCRGAGGEWVRKYQPSE